MSAASASRLSGFVLAVLALRAAAGTTLAAVPSVGIAVLHEAERWIAVSNTAISITGNAMFTPAAIDFHAGGGLTLHYLRDVPATVSFLGNVHSGTRAQLYRVVTPVRLKLRSGNALCDDPATFVSVLRMRTATGTDIALTVYSGLAEPTGEPSDKLCAGYTYTVAR